MRQSMIAWFSPLTFAEITQYWLGMAFRHSLGGFRKSSRLSLGFSFCCCALAAFLLVESALAAETATTRLVIVCGGFESDDIEPIERTIVSQLEDLNTSVDFHYIDTLPEDSDAQVALAKTHIDNYGATAAFIIYPRDLQVMVRTLLLTDSGMEVSRRTVEVASGAPLHESLGVIVRAAADTLIERAEQLARESIDRAPRDSTDAAKSPKAPDPPESSSDARQNTATSSGELVDSGRMYFGVGVALGLYAKGAPPWVGMDLSLGWQPIRHWFIHVGYVSLAKVSKRAHDVTLTINRNPIRLGVGYERKLKRFSLGGGVAFGLDYATEKISSGNTSLTLRAEDAEVNLAALASLHGEVELVGPLCFFLNVEMEIPVYSAEYRLEIAGDNPVILRLLPVQPLFRAGFRVYFF